MEELRSLIETEAIISVKWLACKLEIDFIAAKLLLSEFREKNDDVRATYVISGTKNKNEISFVMVAEEKLEKMKSKFHIIHDLSIYSLQKCLMNTLPLQIANRDYEQMQEKLMKVPGNENFLLNKLNNIHLSKIPNILPVGKRLALAYQRKSMVVDAANTTTDKTHSKSNAFSNAPKKSQVQDSKPSAVVQNFFNQSKSSLTEKHKEIKESKPSDKANRNSLRDSEVKLVDKTVENDKNSESNQSPVQDDVKGNCIMEDDAEWDDGDGYKPDKSKLKKRAENEEQVRRKHIIIDDEEELYNTSPICDENTAKDNIKKKKTKTKAQKTDEVSIIV
jgi:hypothetical protein